MVDRNEGWVLEVTSMCNFSLKTKSCFVLFAVSRYRIILCNVFREREFLAEG